MRLGLLCTAQANGAAPQGSAPGQGFRDYLELNVAADRLGFHSTFLVEHHFSGWSQVSAPLTLLTALAMKTTNIRLGTAVLVLPWHNPVLLAEQAATVDLLSGGRLDLGIGKGYRHNEFTGFCVDPETSQGRFDEAVEVIRRSWTETVPFTHTGRYWQFQDVLVEPRPAQDPHPPLWVAAARDASIRQAASAGFNLLLDQYASPSQIQERIASYREAQAAAGVAARPGQIAVARQIYVATDPDDARAALDRQAAGTRRTVQVSRSPRASSGSHVLAYAGDGGTEAHALFATSEVIETGLANLADLGVDYVLAQAFDSTEQLERIAALTLPIGAGRSTEDSTA